MLKINKLVIFVSLAILVLSLGANVVLLTQWQKDLTGLARAEDERLRPANLSLTVINPEACEDCWPADELLSFIKSQNVKIESENIISVNDEAAQAYLEEFTPARLPAVVISGEVDKEAAVSDLLSRLKAVNVNDKYLIVAPQAPYVEWPANNKRGELTIQLLAVKQCAECYDVNLHRQALANFGVPVINVELIVSDSAAGQELIKKYNITAAPTLVFNGDVEAYAALHQIWPSVGSIESDGAHVLRKVEQMGVYYDLIKKSVIKPAS